MDRRACVSILIVGLLGALLAAEAQSAVKAYRVGVLGAGTAANVDHAISGAQTSRSVRDRHERGSCHSWCSDQPFGQQGRLGRASNALACARAAGSSADVVATIPQSIMGVAAPANRPPAEPNFADLRPRLA